MERRGRYPRAREWRSLGTKEAESVKKGVRSLDVAGSGLEVGQGQRVEVGKGQRLGVGKGQRWWKVKVRGWR
jgi:hypothetical protein